MTDDTLSKALFLTTLLVLTPLISSQRRTNLTVPSSSGTIKNGCPIRLNHNPSLLEIFIEENLIASAIKYFIDNITPLTQDGLCHLDQHTVELLPDCHQHKISFLNGRPSKKWIRCFLKRHTVLKLKTMRAIEDKRTCAVTTRNVGEHIARFQAAMKRYCIKEACRVFNLDESGFRTSFRDMCGKSLRKRIGYKNKDLVCTVVRTRGNLDRVTVMPIVSAAGTALRPIVVFPGKQPHFRRVKGVVQTVINYLPTGTYFFQRETPGVDSRIFYAWAKLFLDETESLREGGKRILLVLDGYSGHIQFDVLQLLKDNHVIVIGMPAHTSHVLQPLDVSVFGPYKSTFQKEIHARARETKVLDAFDIADALSVSYASALTPSNIMSGFRKTRTWDPVTLSASPAVLQRLPFSDLSKTCVSGKLPSLQEIVETFSRKSRSLLFDAGVEEYGTIRINTTAGAHLTNEKVLEALALRKSKQGRGKRVGSSNDDVEESHSKRCKMTETPEELQHLNSIAGMKAQRRTSLKLTRKARRSFASSRAM